MRNSSEYTQKNIEDDDEMYLIKEAVEKALNPVQRKIFLTYTELGTYTATAKEFKVSVPTIKAYIQGLRGKIYEYVDDNIEPDTD